jgi:hypothetical protein
MITKECERCGQFFEAKTEKRKYCDKCQNHGAKIEARIAKNYRRIEAMYGDWDKPRDMICKQCGKPFQGNPRVSKYCSNACLEDYIAETSVCKYCGKPLLPEIRRTTYAPNVFHAECRKKYEAERIVAKDLKKVCPVCNKEYLAKKSDQKYCSQACAAISRTSLEFGKEFTCAVCGAKFKVSTNSSIGRGMRVPTCSPKCEDIQLQKQRKQWNKEQELFMAKCYASRKDSTKAKPKSINSQVTCSNKSGIKSSKSKTGLTTSSLCSICRTSYKNCPYISSGFKLLPDGAVCEDSKVIECPLYTDKKK